MVLDDAGGVVLPAQHLHLSGGCGSLSFRGRLLLFGLAGAAKEPENLLQHVGEATNDGLHDRFASSTSIVVIGSDTTTPRCCGLRGLAGPEWITQRLQLWSVIRFGKSLAAEHLLIWTKLNERHRLWCSGRQEPSLTRRAGSPGVRAASSIGVRRVNQAVNMLSLLGAGIHY